MTSEDVIWSLGSWMVSNVDVDTLRTLVGCDDPVIEVIAEQVYEKAVADDADKDLHELLGNLSSWRDHPSTKGAHLSGLRSALRYISKAGQQYSQYPWARRLKMYRQLMAAPATSQLSFISPRVATSKEAVA